MSAPFPIVLTTTGADDVQHTLSGLARRTNDGIARQLVGLNRALARHGLYGTISVAEEAGQVTDTLLPVPRHKALPSFRQHVQRAGERFTPRAERQPPTSAHATSSKTIADNPRFVDAVLSSMNEAVGAAVTS